MKIVVIGATGTIGKAVSDLLIQKGHEVIAGSRSSNPKIDITEPMEIERFFKEVGEVDAIVSAAGSAAFVALDKIEAEDIQLSLHSKLMGQINAVRKGLKNLRPNGVAVITGGILAYNPMPQTAMIAMVNAGLEGFARGAALDLTEGRRILVVHPPWLSETATALGMDPSPYPNAATVAKAYVNAVEGDQTGVPIFVEGHLPK